MVAIIYRPPKQQQADDTALYEEIKSTIWNKNAVIVRDFNCLSINWNSVHGDQEGSRLIEMVEDSYLSQIVTQPTQGNNILDLVLTTDADLISDCGVGEILCGCDHHMIRFNIRTNTNWLKTIQGTGLQECKFWPRTWTTRIWNVGAAKRHISWSRMERLQR